MARGGFTKDMGRRFGSPSWKPTQIRYALAPFEAPPPALRGTARVAAKPMLAEDERGAVWPLFPADAFPKAQTFVFNQYEVPHEDIRSALLFFDKFDVPDQRIIGGWHWCASEFRRVGILASSFVDHEGDMADGLLGAPFRAFEARDKMEPGRWTLARPAQTLGFPSGLLTPSTAIAITIQNALPVFTRAVDLEDVLEFKARAADELKALRTHLDELAVEIGRNGANNISESAPFRRFHEALEAHVTLMNESNREKLVRSFRASFDWTALTGPGAELLYTGSLDIPGLAAGAATIGIKTVAGLRRKRTGSNPFEFLTSAHLEL